MSAQARTRAEALRWLERYVASVDEPALAELALQMARETAAGVPELGAVHELEVELEPLARENIRSFFAAVTRDPWPEPDVPVAGLEFTRMLARRGADLPLLLKIYRLGQRAFWSRSMEIAERDIHDPALRIPVLTMLWDRLGLWVEYVVGRQLEVFSEERDRWVRGALARRAETVHAILAGEQRDEERAGQILGHELHRHQTAFVLWPRDAVAPPDALARMEALSATLAAAVGGTRALTVASGARGLWAWVGTDAQPALERLGLPQAQDDDGIRVAVGRPGFGIAGFVRSHEQALEAQRVAAAGAGDRLVTSFADLEVVCMLSHDETAMRALVERELRGISGADPASARLRETALAFLRCGSNARAAAAGLGAHRNTVLYRLRRVEELLGHPIDDRRLELEVALVLADAFGGAVLPDAPAARS